MYTISEYYKTTMTKQDFFYYCTTFKLNLFLSLHLNTRSGAGEAEKGRCMRRGWEGETNTLPALTLTCPVPCHER